jgi:CHAT domain-containing protein
VRAKLTADLSALREQYRDLLVEIRAANPKLSAFVTVEPPTLAAVQKAIGPDTALLEYHVAAKETIVWTITSTTMRVTRIPLGREALGKDVMAYLADLEAIRPVDERAKAFEKTLVEPALGADTKGKRYLGIVPHGKLHYLPFAALRNDTDYLIDRYSLFYIPSAAVLPLDVASAAAPSDKSFSKVLAIGNPDLGDPSFSLPFADLEVGDLKLDFPQIDVLTHERATDRWVAKNIGNYRVIHFACHGEFDPVNPLFSAIRLAKDPGTDGNGALTAHEIFGLPVHAELVTLSACRTGLSNIEGGDELIGLNRAFLYAGTRSIMSTLWRVHDGSTAVLVKHFYRNYTRESKADALRDSMRTVRDYYPHPAYWAAFALTGEYR